MKRISATGWIFIAMAAGIALGLPGLRLELLLASLKQLGVRRKGHHPPLVQNQNPVGIHQ